MGNSVTALIIALSMLRNATIPKKISDLIHYVHVFKIMHAVLYNYLLFHKLHWYFNV